MWAGAGRAMVLLAWLSVAAVAGEVYSTYGAPPNAPPSVDPKTGNKYSYVRSDSAVLAAQGAGSIGFCEDMPSSIEVPRGSRPQEGHCVYRRLKTTVQMDERRRDDHTFDVKTIYAYLGWMLLLPAGFAVACLIDKPSPGTWLDKLGGFRRMTARLVLLAVTLSPIVFAILWDNAKPDSLVVMIDNANRGVAHVRIGETRSLDIAPMHLVFVRIERPADVTPIRVLSSDGQKEEVTLPLKSDNADWIYNIGGSNTYDVEEPFYR
jgi:hypothetical protein